MIAFGGVGVLAAMTRANPGQFDWVPSLVAGITAAVALSLLIARVPGRARTPGLDVARGTGCRPPSSRDPSRRSSAARFLLWTVGTAAVGVLATIGSTLARAGAQAVTRGARRPHAPGAGIRGRSDSGRRPSSASPDSRP